MNRRNLIKSLTIGSGALASGFLPEFSTAYPKFPERKNKLSGKELHTDIIIAGAAWAVVRQRFQRYEMGWL